MFASSPPCPAALEGSRRGCLAFRDCGAYRRDREATSFAVAECAHNLGPLFRARKCYVITRDYTCSTTIAYQTRKPEHFTLCQFEADTRQAPNGYNACIYWAFQSSTCLDGNPGCAYNRIEGIA